MSVFYRFLFCFSVLVSLFFFTGNSQTRIAPYRPGVTSEGISYFLPITRLHIVVRAQKEHYQPGEYAQWAERFLEVKNVAQEEGDTWTIKSIEVYPYGEADHNRAYTIKLDNRSSAPLVSLAPDGVLLGINTRVKPLAALERPSVTADSKVTKLPATFKSQEIIRATSLAAKAEVTAQEIYDIRENRTLLAKGQADFQPKDGQQLKLMLDHLNEQESALTSIFLGTTARENHVFTFDFTPTKDVEALELFRFSKHLGLLEHGDLAGDPVRISVTNQNTLPIIDEAALSKREKGQRDLRYCNPSNARVQIFTTHQKFFDTSLPFAQFGRVEHLGGKLFDRKFDILVTLSPSTGALERVDQETKTY